MSVQLLRRGKYQINVLLFIIKIGIVMGFLPVKFNPLKLNTKGFSHRQQNSSPFEMSWILLLYDCILWLICTLVSVHVCQLAITHLPKALFLIIFFICTIQAYFIFWILFVRKSLVKFLNRLVQLIQDSSKLKMSVAEWLAPFFPLMIISLLRIAINIKMYIRMPFFTFLDIYQNVGMVFTNGLIYTWILYAEKLVLNIEDHVKLRWRRLSFNKLKLLMTHYLETEAFLYSISKSCGIPYLIVSIATVLVDVMYSNSQLYSVMPAAYDTGLQYFKDLLDFVCWNYSLYIMACVSYRSHRLNIQVKTLKWSLDEVQTKGILDIKLLQMVHLFEKRINEKNVYFSAVGGINFNVSLIIVVLNKILTYLFAITPMRQP